MEIRKLTTDKNLELMAEFFKNVFMGPPWNDDWSNTEQLYAYIRDIAGCFNSINFGLFDDEKIVGLSMGHKHHWWGGTEYKIEEFCISPDCQGKGLGTKFLEEIEKIIPSDDMTQIFLQTEKNVPAYGFYKKRGFEELEGHVSFWKQVGECK